MSCSSANAIFPRAFAFPYDSSSFIYNSISVGDNIASIVATGSVSWQYDQNTRPWPGSANNSPDFDEAITVGDTSPSSAVIMHLLPIEDYASAVLYGFDTGLSGQYLYTDVGFIGSTVM